MFMTLKEAANQAGIHENTARFYRDKYEKFFPVTGEGRHRKYGPATVDILQTIKKCYDSGMDADAVLERLGEQYGIPVLVNAVAVQTPQEEFAAVVVKRLKQQIETALVQQAAAHSEEIKILQNEIRELKEKISKSEDKRENRDQEIMQMIRNIQTESNERKNLPFYKRWFK